MSFLQQTDKLIESKLYLKDLLNQDSLKRAT